MPTGLGCRRHTQEYMMNDILEGGISVYYGRKTDGTLLLKQEGFPSAEGELSEARVLDVVSHNEKAATMQCNDPSCKSGCMI